MRPPNGRDEAFVYETRQSGSLARCVTAFLARLVQRIGPVSKVTPQVVADLTVGDREALLLEARRLTLGNRIHALLHCPQVSCGAPLDLDLAVDELLTAPYADAAVEHEISQETAAGVFRVRFRLPTGADQEAAAAASTPEQGAAVILQRTVREVQHDGVSVKELPSEVADQISDRMGDLDPQAELNLTCSCPSCGGTFSSILDAAAYFFEELSARAQGLFRDVHLLAFYYHWSERSILALPCGRRRTYVGLLEQELARGAVR